MPEPTLDDIPFRLEFIGDPLRPYIVYDGGDHSRPFRSGAGDCLPSDPVPNLRSIPGDHNSPFAFVQLWEAYVHKSAAERMLRDELATHAGSGYADAGGGGGSAGPGEPVTRDTDGSDMSGAGGDGGRQKGGKRR